MIKEGDFIYLDRMNSWILKNLIFLVSSMVLVFFLLELTNRVYFFFYSESRESLSFYLKIFLQLIFVIPVLCNYKSLSKDGKMFIIFSIVIMVVGMIRFSQFSFVGGIKHYNKIILYFYVFLFFILFKPKSKILYKIFDWIFIVNAILIFIGLLTGFEYLKSYPFTDRFGYSGVFSRYAINDVSLFYLIGNFYLYIRWRRRETTALFFLVVFVSSFFVGTKAIYLQNFILTAFVIVSDKRLGLKISVFASLAILILFFVYNFSFWENIVKSRGLLAALSSLRTELLLQRLPIAVSEGSVLNLLFGFRDPFRYFVEMDFVDMIFSFGIVGTALIFFFYFRILFLLQTNNKTFHYLFMSTFFLMVLISGRYTYSGMNAIYLPLFLHYLGNDRTESEKVACRDDM